MTTTVLVTRQDNVVTVTLNRPESFNAINAALSRELCEAIEQCQDATVRAVIVTGAGRAFSGGGDMREAHDVIINGGDRARFFRDLTSLAHRAITDIRLLPKPVIAAINGTAAGAGFSIAMACDLRIAGAGAKFKQAYTSMALVPDCGWTVTVPPVIGVSRASELLLLDPVLDAQQAVELGIVNRIVPDGDLVSEAQSMAQRLANGPTRAYAEAKALLNASLMPALETQLERERQGIATCSKTEDFRRAVEAFLAKAKAEFIGM